MFVCLISFIFINVNSYPVSNKVEVISNSAEILGGLWGGDIFQLIGGFFLLKTVFVISAFENQIISRPLGITVCADNSIKCNYYICIQQNSLFILRLYHALSVPNDSVWSHICRDKRSHLVDLHSILPCPGNGHTLDIHLCKCKHYLTWFEQS